MNPAASINGITHQVKMAPPVSITSVTFIAASIEIIEMRDMPIAVWKANLSAICLERIIVSSKIDVISPLKIARLITAQTGQLIPVNWKKVMVPKSPIEQPSKHQEVFLDAAFQVCLQRQLMAKCKDSTVIFELPYRDV